MSVKLLSKSVEKGLLTQVSKELSYSTLYLSASFYFNSLNFNGIEKYLRKEYNNELTHALLICDYIQSRGTNLTNQIFDIKLESLNNPKIKENISKWESPLNVFEDLYNCELNNFDDLNNLMTLSQKHKDNCTYHFLSKMLDEQLKSTNELEIILSKVKSYSSFQGLLWHLDKEI